MTAQPIVPNVDAATYEADKSATAVVVHKSMPRIVQIGPFKFRLVAEDWPSIKDAETAASRAVEILRIYHPAFDKNAEVTGILDELADRIVKELEIDPSRPFGNALIVEPV